MGVVAVVGEGCVVVLPPVVLVLVLVLVRRRACPSLKWKGGTPLVVGERTTRRDTETETETGVLIMMAVLISILIVARKVERGEGAAPSSRLRERNTLQSG